MLYLYPTHFVVKDFLFLLSFNYFNILITIFVHGYLEVFVYVYSFVCGCMFTCMWPWRGQRFNPGYGYSEAIYLAFEIGFLSGTWCSTIQPGRLTQEPQVFAFLHLPIVGITSVTTMSVFSCGCWELKWGPNACTVSSLLNLCSPRAVFIFPIA